MARPGNLHQFARALGLLRRPGNRDQFVGRPGFRTRNQRRPGDGSMPALVEPPHGPKPLQGGAAAALEFDS
jgi:hypothetical protein